WPISPSGELEMRSGAILRAPPARPATHSSWSFSRLTSNSRAALRCGMGSPFADQPMDFVHVAFGEQLVAQRLVAEHLRQLGKDLQVQVGGLFGNQEDEDQVHRLAVRRIEGNWLAQAHERTHRLLQPFD